MLASDNLIGPARRDGKREFTYFQESNRLRILTRSRENPHRGIKEKGKGSGTERDTPGKIWIRNSKYP